MYIGHPNSVDGPLYFGPFVSYYKLMGMDIDYFNPLLQLLLFIIIIIYVYASKRTKIMIIIIILNSWRRVSEL